LDKNISQASAVPHFKGGNMEESGKVAVITGAASRSACRWCR
jgi:hypothetical protein